MKESSDAKKRYSIYVPEELMTQLKHWCLDNGVNTSQVIEKLIMEKIKKEKKDDK